MFVSFDIFKNICLLSKIKKYKTSIVKYILLFIFVKVCFFRFLLIYFWFLCYYYLLNLLPILFCFPFSRFCFIFVAVQKIEKMPVSNCIVCGFNWSEVERFHKFPKNIVKRTEWKEALKLTCGTEILENQSLCNRHFTPNCYQDATKTRLNRNAVPTLFPAQMILSQLRCAPKQPKGRRWNIEEKILSLSLYKRSPKCYTLLRSIFVLPCQKTLTNLLQKVPFGSGIKNHLFQHLGRCITDDKSRICSLMFDEMSLKEHIQHDRFTDSIVGIEDFGSGNRGNNPANHALVFMVRGVVTNWKQPVAYYFSSGGVSSEKLKPLLLKVLDALQYISGLHVISTACDMGTANVKSQKELGSTPSHPYFIHNFHPAYNLFDAPHLLKCTRNLFLKHPIQIPIIIADNKEKMDAQWVYVQKAYTLDFDMPAVFRLLYKLTADHMSPMLQMSMKVRLAAQVLSRTVSSFIYQKVQSTTFLMEAVATATFIQKLDEMFDSFNGGATLVNEAKPLLGMMTPDSPHFDYFSKMIQEVAKWQYVRK